MINWKKIKPQVNLIIDILMFIVLMAVAGLGFMMKFVLLPGYRINEVYGQGTELYFWGLDRHQWGAIHLYLALSMVFLLVFHIILHWDSIVCIFKRLIPGRSMRWIIAPLIVIISIVFLMGPVLVKPEVAELERQHNRNRVVTDNERGYYYRSESLHNEDPGVIETPNGTNDEEISATEVADSESIIHEDSEHQHLNQVNIDGTMTLNQVSASFNISIEDLAKAIDIPVSYADERLGRLRRTYGFEMEDLRDFVSSRLSE